MFKKIVILIIISLFFGAGVISNVVGNNLSEYKINKKELLISDNCLLNNPPMISNPNPENGAIVTIDLDELSVFIEDPDEDRMNWTIETSPNIGSNNGNMETTGSKYCSISQLTFSQTYKWYVNVTDGENWVKEVFYFITGEEPDYIPTIQKILIDVVDRSGRITYTVGIVNNYDNITQWTKTENTIKIEWEIRNEKQLKYVGKPLTINTRSREYQFNSFLPGMSFFLETGRIYTPGHSWHEINIEITDHSSTGEYPIPIKLTELDNMTMVTGTYYLELNAKPMFLTSASGNSIIFN